MFMFLQFAICNLHDDDDDDDDDDDVVKGHPVHTRAKIPCRGEVVTSCSSTRFPLHALIHPDDVVHLQIEKLFLPVPSQLFHSALNCSRGS